MTVGVRGATRADFAVFAGGITRIAEIQGRGHLSPYAGKPMSAVPGVVTALRPPAGFFMQSPLPDSSPDTSEGLFVAASRMPEVSPGDLVMVDGVVEEHYAGGEDSGGLSVTRLALSGLRRLGTDFGVPEPVVIGQGGRVPPDRIVCNDADGNAERSPFDPGEDGIDFYESLEGMLVRVNDALVVGSIHTGRGEFQVVGDSGRRASALTARGGLALLAGDMNPERITVDLKAEPDIAPQQIQQRGRIGAAGERHDQRVTRTEKLLFPDRPDNPGNKLRDDGHVLQNGRHEGRVYRKGAIIFLFRRPC